MSGDIREQTLRLEMALREGRRQAEARYNHACEMEKSARRLFVSQTISRDQYVALLADRDDSRAALSEFCIEGGGSRWNF